MEFKEFGDSRNPKIMLIHGMATTWDICYKAAIDELKNDFFIIVPVLDGHNPNEQSDFCSIQDAPIGIFSKLCTKLLVSQICRVKENRPFHFLMRKVMEFGKFDEDAFRKAFFSDISQKSIMNCLGQLLEYKIPKNLSTIKADVTYWYGSHESFAAKSARNLKKVLPHLKIRSFEKYGHGELFTKYPKQGVSELKRLF
ncbi:hypothetical protein RhiirA1_404377, partial [Rhizophagus irregularis]